MANSYSFKSIFDVSKPNNFYIWNHNKMNLSAVYDFFNNPQTALIIILIFFLVFLLSEGLTVGFGNNFLSFGPTQDEDGKPTKFMGINVDSWSKVGVIYTITFIASLLSAYYNTNVYSNIHAYVWNPAVKKVPFSKFWTYLILILNPIIQTLLYVIQFFATATFQLQYIIPQFVASYIVDLPFTLKWLSGKTFL